MGYVVFYRMGLWILGRRIRLVIWLVFLGGWGCLDFKGRCLDVRLWFLVDCVNK